MQKNKKTSLDKTVHTLNNILTNVGLSAEMLLKELYGEVNSKQKKYLKIILSEGKRMQKLIKKIK